MDCDRELEKSIDATVTDMRIDGTFQFELIDDALSNELADETVINDQFRVLSKLGSGGMSHVYMCEDMQLNRVVAIKLLRVDLSANSPGGLRFQREAQIVAMLEQENIVKLYGLHLTENRQPFIVMEFVKGESLADIIEKFGRLPLPRAIRFISQICDALAAAHAQGVIHRDLKPSNIMVINAGSNNEKLKLLDFGIAKVANDQQLKATRTGEVFGSPVYMSPEQAQGRVVDDKTDQYSFGCLIFELLTGRTPFVENNLLSLMTAHVRDPAPSLSQVGRRQFPLQIERAVSRMLEKDPGKRFASIAEVKHAFVGLAPGSEPVSGHWRNAIAHRLMLVFLSVGMILWGVGFIWPNEGERANNVISPSIPNAVLELPSGLTSDEVALFRRLRSEPRSHTLDLRNQQITDVGMKAFAGFRFVDRVSLVGCYKVTDMGLKYLVGWPLQRLYLSGTQLSDEGMETVCSIPTLSALDLSETYITNDGCNRLDQLPHLRELHLSRTSITNAVLSKIGKLTSLEELNLNGDDVGGNLSALGSLQLRELQLAEAGLQDSDMPALATMSSLLELNVARNKQISDLGLSKLGALKNLRRLYIGGCTISERGLRAIKDMLPQCAIISQDNLSAETMIKSIQSSMP